MGYTLRGEEWLLTCATKQLVGSVLAVPDAVTLLAQGDAGVLQQAVVHIQPVTAEREIKIVMINNKIRNKETSVAEALKSKLFCEARTKIGCFGSSSGAELFFKFIFANCL